MRNEKQAGKAERVAWSRVHHQSHGRERRLSSPPHLNAAEVSVSILVSARPVGPGGPRPLASARANRSPPPILPCPVHPARRPPLRSSLNIHLSFACGMARGRGRAMRVEATRAAMDSVEQDNSREQPRTATDPSSETRESASRRWLLHRWRSQRAGARTHLTRLGCLLPPALHSNHPSAALSTRETYQSEWAAATGTPHTARR